MSQKLGVILPPTAAPQLLAGEKHNSQRALPGLESSMSTLRSGPRLILKAKIVQIRLK